MITVALGGFLFVIFRCYRNNSIRLSSFFNRRVHWEYYRELYKKHNEVEKLFRRLKGYRRVFSRFDILGVISMWFIVFALIFDMLRQCEHALVVGWPGRQVSESHEKRSLRLGLIPKWRANDLNWLGGELLTHYDYPIPFEHEQMLYFDFKTMLSIEKSQRYF